MCLRPITVKTEDAFGIPVNQSVPCGKCIECLKDRQNSWKIRLTEEARDHLHVYFFTLTYNEDSVPHVFLDDGTQVNHVRKSDIQLWVKRNRIKYERLFNRDIDFKYFITSEYGPNTGRPHYHGIFFTDISPTFISSMFNDWCVNYGFVNFSEVGKSGKKIVSKNSLSSVANYVAKYCLKVKDLNTPMEKQVNEYIKDGIIPPTFFLMSKGIGASYVKRMKRYHVPNYMSPRDRISKVCDRAFYHDGAFKYKLPRFYRDRLYRMKFPCDARIWSNKTKCYENKTVYRYKSKNLLSLQMQTEIRSRVLAEYNERVAEYRASNPCASDTEVYLALSRLDWSAKLDRQKNIYSKMSRFYNSQRFKSRDF